MAWSLYKDLICKECGNEGTISKKLMLCQACYMRKYYASTMTETQKQKKRIRQRRYAAKLRYTDDEKYARKKAQGINNYIYKHNNRAGISVEELTKFIMDNINKPCRYCGSQARHVDHRFPLSRGGKHVLENLEMICEYCNISKNDRTEEEFLLWIEKISIMMGNLPSKGVV